MSEVMELKPEAVLAVLHQQGRMPLKQLAVAVGVDPTKMSIPAMRLPGVQVSGDDVFLVMTQEDRQDLQVLEEKVSHGQRESIAALQAIRERKLYREQYSSFDEYMSQRWNRSRQWATQQTNWLRRTELLEASGKNSYQLTVGDAQILGPLEDHPDLFVRAVVEADTEGQPGKKGSRKKMLQAVVERMLAYQGKRSGTKPDLTYDEFVGLDSLGGQRQVQPNLVDEAQQQATLEKRPVADCLVDVCQNHHALPNDSQLLAVARGNDLLAMLQPLAVLQTNWEQERQLVKQQQEVEAKLAKVRKAQKAEESKDESADEPDEDQDEELAEEPEAIGPEYQVRLTGDFVHWAEWQEDGAEVTLLQDDLANLLGTLAEILEQGDSLNGESSITVRSTEPKQQE